MRVFREVFPLLESTLARPIMGDFYLILFLCCTCTILSGMTSSLLLAIFSHVSSVGVLSQFSSPSGDICAGSDIEFSCVGNSELYSFTQWEITPDGDEPPCVVLHNIPELMQRCGPDRIFTSSLTGQTGLSYTSSLRAEDVPLSLNGTVVECRDGADIETIGSTNICIVGKYNTDPIIEWSHSPCQVVYWCQQKSSQPQSQREMWERKSVW